jgi:hypothetical protein
VLRVFHHRDGVFVFIFSLLIFFLVVCIRDVFDILLVQMLDIIGIFTTFIEINLSLALYVFYSLV